MHGTPNFAYGCGQRRGNRKISDEEEDRGGDGCRSVSEGEGAGEAGKSILWGHRKCDALIMLVRMSM